MKKSNADKYLLPIIIGAQPLLDIIAYWNANSVATLAGYIRLAVLICLPVYLLFKIEDKKKIIVPMAIIGAFCLLHVLNGFRVGYMNIFSDVQYILRVIQTPVLTVCFILLISDDDMLKGGIDGIKIAIILYMLGFVIALITGSYTPTYSDNIGYSTWVIDGNRCANSIILVILCVFCMYYSYIAEKHFARLVLPIIVVLTLIANGTKSCYISALGLMAAYGAFAVLEAVVKKTRLKVSLLILTVLLFIGSVIVYPYTPRAKEDNAEGRGVALIEQQFRETTEAAGYDIDNMTVDEKLADPYLFELYETYYYTLIDGSLPELLRDYDVERVFRSYDMTIDAATLIDVRIMKRTYAKFIFEDSDAITRLVGFEFENIGYSAERLDLENDYPALFYYYGYIGFTLMVLFLLWFILRTLRCVFCDFKASLTPLNYTLIVCYGLMLILAELSGALFRRPNVSIYLSLVLAVIWYQTRIKKTEGALNV